MGSESVSMLHFKTKMMNMVNIVLNIFQPADTSSQLCLSVVSQSCQYEYGLVNRQKK